MSGLEQDLATKMSESGRTALVLVAGQDRRHAALAPFIAALEAGGMTLIQRDAPVRDRVADLIASMRRTIDCVIVAGGDALMSAGAIALRDAALPLGILPLDDGGDLARRLGITTETAAQVVLDGHAATVDLGSVNGRPFFSTASVGLLIGDSRLLGQAAAAGALRYGWTALKIAFRTRRFSCIIRCGAVVHRVRTIQVTVGNGHLYAGGMTDDAAHTTDALLDMCSLETASRWDLLFMSEVFAAANPAARPEIRAARSAVVEVVTRLPQPIYADGEQATVTPARFSILPGGVAVYAPAPPPN